MTRETTSLRRWDRVRGARRSTRLRCAGAVLIAAVGSVSAPDVWAGEDHDLDLIPKDIVDDTPAPGSAPQEDHAPVPATKFYLKAFLEDAVTLPSRTRSIPVSFPSVPFAWQNRTNLDGHFQWEPVKAVTLSLSDRLSVLEESDLSFGSRQTVRNDFREGYLSWRASPSTYIEAGRINVRNGSALGFNPTDFFKTRTLVWQGSVDPSSLRQNRLGTLMIRGQRVWEGGSASIAYAPRVARPLPITPSDPLGVEPRFSATNAAYRALCTLSADAGEWSTQALGYLEPQRSKLGLNVSRSLGDAVILYAEWAGGPEKNLIARAVEFGQSTGVFTASVPLLPPTRPKMLFRSDLALGGSWTIATKATLNLEYLFHEAGFSNQNWRDWFDMGGAANVTPWTSSELWYVRAYAADQQEPETRHQVFVRIAWPQAFVKELELDALTFVNLFDGSALSQVTAAYFLSDTWTAIAYGSMNTGIARSERGSMPQAGNMVLQLQRYF